MRVGWWNKIVPVLGCVLIGTAAGACSESDNGRMWSTETRALIACRHFDLAIFDYQHGVTNFGEFNRELYRSESGSLGPGGSLNRLRATTYGVETPTTEEVWRVSRMLRWDIDAELSRWGSEGYKGDFSALIAPIIEKARSDMEEQCQRLQ